MDVDDSSGLSWAGSITTLAGVWLVLSPYFFNFSLTGVGLWAQVIAGAVLLVAGLSELVSRDLWPSWLSALVGLWLILAPFSFSVPGSSKWSELIVALVVIGMAAIDGQAVNKLHHSTK